MISLSLRYEIISDSCIYTRVVQRMASVEIKAVKKLHGGKTFDAITKLHRNYFGCKRA